MRRNRQPEDHRIQWRGRAGHSFQLVDLVALHQPRRLVEAEIKLVCGNLVGHLGKQLVMYQRGQQHHITGKGINAPGVRFDHCRHSATPIVAVTP